ncbi:hypothetical protein LTR36_005950 [Oleoguttula mirabilis]|uniref:Uncharacterized protein n=1 Tax=Oleoguttula mirabilis TaxID=1507867 RepID=A0AAV9JER3_9PEZI|nr:hypothetical protein LTR36_005950 [Oleoguttula mirabilis]
MQQGQAPPNTPSRLPALLDLLGHAATSGTIPRETAQACANALWHEEVRRAAQGYHDETAIAAAARALFASVPVESLAVGRGYEVEGGYDGAAAAVTLVYFEELRLVIAAEAEGRRGREEGAAAADARSRPQQQQKEGDVTAAAADHTQQQHVATTTTAAVPAEAAQRPEALAAESRRQQEAAAAAAAAVDPTRPQQVATPAAIPTELRLLKTIRDRALATGQLSRSQAETYGAALDHPEAMRAFHGHPRCACGRGPFCTKRIESAAHALYGYLRAHGDRAARGKVLDHWSRLAFVVGSARMREEDVRAVAEGGEEALAALCAERERARGRPGLD